MCIPHSNAIIEMGFSLLKNIRTKLRNRMSCETLEALLSIKLNPLSEFEWEPNEKMKVWTNFYMEIEEKIEKNQIIDLTFAE